MTGTSSIEQRYALAREHYAAYGVDTEDALTALRGIAVSLHCWQGDDVHGFESDAGLDGGLQATGNYPGRARTLDELRADAALAFRCIPGRHRFNLHAIYADTGGQRVERDALGPEHVASWIDWARAEGLSGLDFNPTFFSHPKAADGFTLSHRDPAIRDFWVAHGIACRRIGVAIGQAMGSPCVLNFWIPDGYKDVPADRLAPRMRLLDSLDTIFAQTADARYLRDAVESKLFGIGSESYVVGSHEFYMGYAVTRRKMLCLDAGHFHPTESIAEKISALLLYLDAVLLHVSRGIRWDSDHVVTLTDDLRAIAEEVVRHGALDRVAIALDYFDASINRIAAWVIGTRALLTALLSALLEPTARLRALEADGDYTARLALLEASKSLPAGAVWDAYCLREDVAVGMAWLDDVRRYEREVQLSR